MDTRVYCPELLAGGALSTAADLYGVACVVYELAHGQRLGGRQPMQALVRPRQLPKRCWPALRSALAVDPERRVLSVAELREAIASLPRRGWL